MPRPATKFDNAECTKLQKESLQCLIENEDTRENCTAFFDRYKKCLKNRRDREIAEKKARFQRALTEK
uniref:CHCH domain-containing protein n=1 Tax=Globisporangium ultimum (strain ATCC 200006 / CBS 805.95 / DAOM BR144) TaxID=431595 RepID=K3WG07_GLOUD